MADVVIFGAGGLGRVVLDILRQAGRHRPVAFLDSDPRTHGDTIDDVRVAGDIEQVDGLIQAGVSAGIVAIGDNHTRVTVAEELRRRGLDLVAAIHPLASISPTAIVSQHVIIGPRVTICVHAHISQDAVLSAGSIIEHDNSIGRGAFLHPAVRLAGAVFVDDFATLGIGACVIPGRRIGRNACVEPGAVVIRDVAPDTTVCGIPGTARPATRPSATQPRAKPVYQTV